MKSKTVLTIAVSVIVVILAACGTMVKQEINNQNPIEVEHQQQEKNNAKENESIGYELIKKVYENQSNNSKIYYPQISGYKGELLMNYMNQTLQKITMRYRTGETYKDANIDYNVTKMDKSILSVLFKGTAKLSDGKEVNIMQSINLDIKTSNSIDFNNLLKSDQASGSEVRAMINLKAKSMGRNSGVEFERLRLYFEGENVVFFYLPADYSSHFVEISIPEKELEGLVNTNFGEKPAS